MIRPTQVPMREQDPKVASAISRKYPLAIPRKKLSPKPSGVSSASGLRVSKDAQ